MAVSELDLLVEALGGERGEGMPMRYVARGRPSNLAKAQLSELEQMIEAVRGSTGGTRPDRFTGSARRAGYGLRDMLPRGLVPAGGRDISGAMMRDVANSVGYLPQRRVLTPTIDDYTRENLSRQALDDVETSFRRVDRKDPVSVTGSTEGDRAVNKALKAEQKAITAAEKAADAASEAERKSGGLFSKLKGYSKTGLSALGLGAAGAALGNKVGSWFDEEGSNTYSNIGMAAGLIGGAALEFVPQVKAVKYAKGAIGGLGLLAGLSSIIPEDEIQPETLQVAQEVLPAAQTQDELTMAMMSLVQLNKEIAAQKEAEMVGMQMLQQERQSLPNF